MAKTAKNTKKKDNSLSFPQYPCKLDQMDYQILWHLDFEARESLTALGAKIGISKQLLKYHIQKLKNQGVLKKAFAIIDIHRLGLVTFRVYYRFAGVNKKTEEEIIQRFVENEHTLWVVSIDGSWDMEVVFVARNHIHFNQIFKDIHYKISRNIRRYNISSSPVSYQLRRDYLISDTRKEFAATYYGFEPSHLERDEIDYKILTELSVDCQQTDDEVAKKIGISNTALARRIKSLENDQIIRVYRQGISLEALNRIYVKALVYLNNLTAKREKEIYQFCSKKSFVAFFTEVVGDWQLEVETEIYDEKQLSDLMKELRAEFPDSVKDYEILRIGKEHKLNYLPAGSITKKLAAQQ